MIPGPIATPAVVGMVREELEKILKVYEKSRAEFQAQTDRKELQFAELRKELIADEKNLDGFTVLIEWIKGQLANGRD